MTTKNLSSNKTILQDKIIKIRNLIRTQNLGNIEGYVLEVEDIKMIELEDGTKKNLQSFRIADSSTQINVYLWEKNILEDLEPFDKVRLNRAYVVIDDLRQEIHINLSKEGIALRIAWPVPLEIPEQEKKCLVDLKRILKINIPIISNISEETFGIQIENGNIIKMGLYLRGISSIPSSITNLKKLKFLTLANNHLNELPKGIGALKNLKTLILKWNRIKNLPDSIGWLSNLQELDIRYNGIKKIPENIGNLLRLEKLMIYDNPIEILPESLKLSVLTNYKHHYPSDLSLSEKRSLIALEVILREKIPKIDYLGRNSFGYIIEGSHIIGLGLYLKRLETFPYVISNFHYLETLNLTKNHLTSLPELNTIFSYLKKIFIGYNKWKKIPEQITGILIRRYQEENIPELESETLVSLELLMNEPIPKLSQWENNKFSVGYLIENNHVVGLKVTNKNLSSIPKWITNLTKLKYLDFSWNNIITIPEWFDGLKKLKELFLSYNKITSFSQNLINLEKLYLNSNQITKITHSIKNAVNLKELDLSHNKISDIPAEIGQLNNLIKINLSFNLLKHIPQSFIQLENLEICDLSINQLIDVPYIDSNMKLKHLDLSHNNIEDISDFVGNLQNLEYLNVFNNKINKIPESLFNMTELTTCDLRLNPLSLKKSQLEFCARLLPNKVLSEEIFFDERKIEEIYSRFQDLDEEECNTIISLEFILDTQLPIKDKMNKNIFGIKIKDNHVIALNLSRKAISVIPKSIGSLRYLSKLYLSNNNLKSLPNEIGELEKLKELYLNKNRLEYLPHTIGSLKNLTKLDLDDNELGFLPDSFQNLISLKILRLKKNPLKYFPSVLWPLENLETLQISREDLDYKLHPTLIAGIREILNLCQYQHFFYEDLVNKIKENRNLDFKDETNPNLCKYAKFLEEECIKVKTRTAKQVLNLLKRRCLIKTKQNLNIML
ncbi:MAG: leucine-rich repeat domain-containing protein [Promethearchaeota archaeon]